MAEVVTEIQELFEIYPSWLVGTCLAIVGVGLIYAVWRLIKASMIIIVALLLVGLVGFAGWFILAS